MAPAARLVVFVACTVALSAGLALAITAVQFQFLGACDPKLGCQGGATTASLFAAVAALGISLTLAFFLQAAAGFAETMPSRRLLVALSLFAAVAVAVWVTSSGWN